MATTGAMSERWFVGSDNGCEPPVPRLNRCFSARNGDCSDPAARALRAERSRDRQFGPGDKRGAGPEPNGYVSDGPRTGGSTALRRSSLRRSTSADPLRGDWRRFAWRRSNGGRRVQMLHPGLAATARCDRRRRGLDEQRSGVFEIVGPRHGEARGRQGRSDAHHVGIIRFNDQSSRWRRQGNIHVAPRGRMDALHGVRDGEFCFPAQ